MKIWKSKGSKPKWFWKIAALAIEKCPKHKLNVCTKCRNEVETSKLNVHHFWTCRSETSSQIIFWCVFLRLSGLLDKKNALRCPVFFPLRLLLSIFQNIVNDNSRPAVASMCMAKLIETFQLICHKTIIQLMSELLWLKNKGCED